MLRRREASDLLLRILVGKVLEAELVEGLRQSAAQCIVGDALPDGRQQLVDRLGKSPVKEMAVNRGRDQSRGSYPQERRKGKAADGIQKKQCADPVVKVFGLPPEGVDLEAGSPEILCA